MKKTLLSILGLAAATLATVTLLGQAEASSSSGGKISPCVDKCLTENIAAGVSVSEASRFCENLCNKK